MLPRSVGRGLQLPPCWDQEWDSLLLAALQCSSELCVLLCAPVPWAELCRWDLTAQAPGTRGLAIAASLQWVGQSSCCLWCWARSLRAAFTPRLMGFMGDPSSKSPERICGLKVASLPHSSGTVGALLQGWVQCWAGGPMSPSMCTPISHPGGAHSPSLQLLLALEDEIKH